MMRKYAIGLSCVGVGVAGLTLFSLNRPLRAADHMEAPGTRADLELDIADVYAWHNFANNRLSTVLTFDGIKAPVSGQQGSYDANALYTVNIDNTGDNVADINIYIRFGQNNAGQWGVQVQNLPGASGTISGAVETTLRSGAAARVYAGLFDDPFFFDLDGFNMTLDTGTLSFDSDRDTFAGSNTTAVVLDMDLASARNGSETIQVWATTARKGN
ncbi:MAG: DUF4331 family protein [Phycisphaerae bacterium]